VAIFGLGELSLAEGTRFQRVEDEALSFGAYRL
jgi:hypothetical protein